MLNPLQQVVFTPGTESADWPAQAAKRNTKRIVTSALSDAVRRGKLRINCWSVNATRQPLDDTHQMNSPKESDSDGANCKNAGVATGHRINLTTRRRLPVQDVAVNLLSRTLTGSSEPDTNTVVPVQTGTKSIMQFLHSANFVMPTAAEASQTETELDNPTSPVPAATQTPAHDCYIDQHGNCPAADTELCDLQCPYRDEK